MTPFLRAWWSASAAGFFAWVAIHDTIDWLYAAAKGKK